MSNKPDPYKAFKLPPSPTALLPGDPVSPQFFTLFPHWWDFIYADIPTYGKKPLWLTQTAYPLDARNAWKAYRDPNVLIGVRFDVTTWYFLFDIDRGSKYHPAVSHVSYTSLLHAMEDAGFTRYTVVSSSESGGLHVYFFLPEAAQTDVLAEALDQLLRKKGFDIGDGTLEVFPNVKGGADVLYKAHRLPLQRNSFVLDPMTFEPRHQDVSAFLREAALDAAGQDAGAIRELLVHGKGRRERRGTRTGASFSTEGGAFRAHLLEQMQQGWTGYGQTNYKLWKIAMYGRIFLGLSDTALTSYIVSTAKASPGYQEFCRHQHEIEKRARDWTRFAMKHYYPYGSERVKRDSLSWQRDWRHTALGIAIIEERRKPQEETREYTLIRLEHVVEELRESGELPKTVRGRAAAIRTKLRELFGMGTSNETLYKDEYRALWHPEYDEAFGMLPDPWEEPVELGGVTPPKADGVVCYATYFIRYIPALPPAREEEKSQNNKIPLEDSKPNDSSLKSTDQHSLSSLAARQRSSFDKPSLSVVPPRSPILPGNTCRVVRATGKGLKVGSLVLVDSVSRSGKTFTVITYRGVVVHGIPPDALATIRGG